MRALFVGGTVDNSELDFDGHVAPPLHYPENTGGGMPRYRLSQLGLRDEGSVAYAVYAAPDTPDEEVARVSAERNYARRFAATPSNVTR